MYAKQLTVFKKIPIGPGGRMLSVVGFLVVRGVVVTAVVNEGSVVAKGLIDVVLRVGVMPKDEDFGAGVDWVDIVLGDGEESVVEDLGVGVKSVEEDCVAGNKVEDDVAGEDVEKSFFLIEKAKLSLSVKKYEKSIFTGCLKVSQGVLK